MAQSESPYDPEQSAATADLVGRYHEVTNGRRDEPETVLAEDVVLHAVERDVTRRGIDEVVGEWREVQRAFPDWSVEVHDVVAQSDMAASRWTNHLTFENEWDGIEPTGEQLTITGLSLFRIEDGKIAEVWDNTDTKHLESQLGVRIDG